jgi:hypothetical protein
VELDAGRRAPADHRHPPGPPAQRAPPPGATHPGAGRGARGGRHRPARRHQRVVHPGPPAALAARRLRSRGRRPQLPRSPSHPVAGSHLGQTHIRAHRVPGAHKRAGPPGLRSPAGQRRHPGPPRPGTNRPTVY